MEHAVESSIPDIIKQCFELGLMAIESPEEYGGAGSTIFNAILAIEELARVDASVSVFVDVHNTLVTNAFMRWANDEQKKKYMPQLAEQQSRCICVERGGLGFGCVRVENPRRRQRRSLRADRPKTLDHERQRSRDLCCSSRRSIRKPATKASRHLSSRNSFEGFSVGKKEDKLGIRASSTTELILDNCKVPKENVSARSAKAIKFRSKP